LEEGYTLLNSLPVRIPLALPRKYEKSGKYLKVNRGIEEGHQPLFLKLLPLPLDKGKGIQGIGFKD